MKNIDQKPQKNRVPGRNPKNGEPAGWLKTDAGPGRPKGSKSYKTVIREALEAALPKEIGDQFSSKFKANIKTYGEAIVAAQVANALKGDARAFNALIDRIEGKPTQAVDLKHEGPSAVIILPDNGKRLP